VEWLNSYILELDADETRALTMVRGTLIETIVTMQDPLDKKYFISLIIKKQRNQEMKIYLAGEKPVIYVKMVLQGDIVNQQSEIGYQDKKLKTILETAYENYICGKIDATIKKCQGMGSDIFGFGEVASKQFWTIQDWESYGWLKKFKDAEVHTEVKLKIKGTGLGVKTNPIKRQEGND
jgi:spore germination protein KC